MRIIFPEIKNEEDQYSVMAHFSSNTGCGKKVSPIFFYKFLSKHRECQHEILLTHLVILCSDIRIIRLAYSVFFNLPALVTLACSKTHSWKSLTELAAKNLSRFHYKRNLASKIARIEPSGLLRLGEIFVVNHRQRQKKISPNFWNAANDSLTQRTVDRVVKEFLKRLNAWVVAARFYYSQYLQYYVPLYYFIWMT